MQEKASIDLSTFTEEELQNLMTQCEEELKGREAERVLEVERQFIELAKSIGMTPDQVVRNIKRRQKDSEPDPAPRYQNPNDSTLTWSGRGRKPGWVEELLAAGTSLEQLEIPANASNDDSAAGDPASQVA